MSWKIDFYVDVEDQILDMLPKRKAHLCAACFCEKVPKDTQK